MSELLANGRVTLHCGDCLDILATLPDNSVDSVVTDPPYHLTSIVKRFGKEGSAPPRKEAGAFARASKGFMQKTWDGGDVAFQPETWAHMLRVLKPGGYLLAFSGTRTYHRMACAIEDAGFDVRDMIAWMYGSGFPKSHNVSKFIDRELGAERDKVRTLHQVNKYMQGLGNQRPWRDAAKENGYHEHDSDTPASQQAAEWKGYGTALKPALEPICMARKPLTGTIAQNVLEHGTGALNIDGCRVDAGELRATSTGGMRTTNRIYGKFANTEPATPVVTTVGRWPANVIHDGSAEVTDGFPETGPSSGGPIHKSARLKSVAKGQDYEHISFGHADNGGSAARFFYTSKADADDRLGSKHPTVKPLDLMQYLCRLVTPKGGTMLDPFAGTGTTGEAAFREGFRSILIEREAEYQNDIRHRMTLVLGGKDERLRAAIKHGGKTADAGPLFGGLLA